MPNSIRSTKSTLTLPSSACDSHAHIFGDPATFPFAPSASYRPAEASKTDYLAMLNRLGLKRMVIVQPSVYGFDNRCTIDAVQSFGRERARGIVMVPSDVESSQLRTFDEIGVCGVRFITEANGGPPIDDLGAIARTVAPLGWHIQMYVDAGLLSDLEQQILRLPVPVVLDHMGGLTAGIGNNDARLHAVLRLLDSGRCWVKLSGYRASADGPPYSDVAPLARRLIEHAPTRCVWGTDWPHPNLEGPVPDDQDLLSLLFQWAPDDATRHRILVENARSLYRFTPNEGED